MHIKIGPSLLYLVMMQIHLNYLWYTVLPEKANKMGFGISIGTAGAVFYEKMQSRPNIHSVANV